MVQASPYKHSSPALALRDALQWLTNHTGESSCLDLDVFEAYTPGLEPGPWTYQRCTEFLMAFSVNQAPSLH